MAGIELRNINKIYANSFHALHDLNFDVRDGEFMVFVGP
jgi:multiple sugar transport system ATP-binding protein